MLGLVNNTGSGVSRLGLAGAGAGAALATKVGLADCGAGVFADTAAEPTDAVGGVLVITPARTGGTVLLRPDGVAAGVWAPGDASSGLATDVALLALSVTAAVGLSVFLIGAAVPQLAGVAEELTTAPVDAPGNAGCSHKGTCFEATGVVAVPAVLALAVAGAFTG